MIHQDQNQLETVVSQLSDGPSERKERPSASRPYYPPQVSLVGQAKRLMAGAPYAPFRDTSGWFKQEAF